MLEVVEYSDVDLVVCALLLKKLSETVCEVVSLGELEDRLVYLLAEPYNCLAHELRCPFAWADEPWSYVSCEE